MYDYIVTYRHFVQRLGLGFDSMMSRKNHGLPQFVLSECNESVCDVIWRCGEANVIFYFSCGPPHHGLADPYKGLQTTG